MCGIAGLQITNPGVAPPAGRVAGADARHAGRARPRLHRGGHLRATMRRPARPSTRCAPRGTATTGTAWPARWTRPRRHRAGRRCAARGRDAVLVTGLAPERVRDLLAGIDPQVRMFGFGAAIEVYKDTGPAPDVCARYGVDRMARLPGHRAHPDGDRVGGHDRALAPVRGGPRPGPGAQRVVLELRQHPARPDRRRASGSTPTTTPRWPPATSRGRLAAGADLAEALRRLMKVFDGFYTLLVATRARWRWCGTRSPASRWWSRRPPTTSRSARSTWPWPTCPASRRPRSSSPPPEEIYTWPA